MTDDSAAPRVPEDDVLLQSGASMPLLGFGTWQIRGDDAVRATAVALETGYSHLDTATVYGNEGEVGRALSDSGMPRGDVFVTTKFPPNRRGEERATLERSLELLRTDYVDLWLIHWPDDPAEALQIWGELIAARDAGLARDIGVSNFGIDLVDRLTNETGTKPAVNQIEWSPLLFDHDVLAAHREREVVLEGYSALRGGTLEHHTIGAIAQRLGRTPAQVIIRWHLQHRIVVIPKSTHPERIRSNADVGGFELSAEDMAALDGLGSTS